MTVIFQPMNSIKKNRKGEKIERVDVIFFLDIFQTTAWVKFNKIKNDLTDIFFNYMCNFLYTKFIKLKLYVIM